MPFNQVGETVTHRVPAVQPLNTRQSATIGTDSYMQNMFVERAGERVYAVKRPGLASAYTYNGGGATNGQGVVYYKGILFAIGSNTAYTLTSSIPIASTLGTSDWVQTGIDANAPWSARQGFATCVANRKVWIFGGIDTAGNYFSDVWSTTDFVTWKQEANNVPWPVRFDHQVLFFNEKFYVIGGFNGSGSLNDVWSSADGVNWEEETSSAFASARHNFGACVFNNGMYVIGGYNQAGLTALRQVYYSVDGRNWQLISGTPAWSARSGIATVVYGNRIYILGGTTDNLASGVLNQVYYTEDGQNWTQSSAAAFGSARSNMLVTVYQGQMIATGGFDSLSVARDEVYSSTDGATWTQITNAPGFTGIFRGGIATFPTPSAVSTVRAWTVYVFGGILPSASSNAVYYGQLDSNIGTSAALTTSGANNEQFQFTETSSGDWLVFKNTYNLWAFYAGTAYQVTDTNYPSRTVPGVVNLNGSIYVMTSNGEIFGSFIEDPLRWSSLNQITAEYESDAGVYLGKVQNYIVAFGETTIQFFFDAGNPEGSPLRPVQNATAQVGCFNAYTVANMDTTLIFGGRSQQQGRGIYMLAGTSIQKISTPAVDRLLNAATVTDTTVHATCVETGGHNWYLLTLVNSNITLAWDSVEKDWQIWRTGDSSYFRAINYATDGTNNWMQDKLLGIVYNLSQSTYGDNSATISCVTQTDKLDFNGNMWKFCCGTQIIGDRRAVGASNSLSVQWSDNDAQTFSTARTVDLTSGKPYLPRCGRFRRRIFKLTHTSSTEPLRLEAIEVTIEPGDL